MTQTNPSTDLVDNAVAEGGAYEVISKRLIDQGKSLESEAKRLNENRLGEFGSSEMDVVARARMRTENNCIARDIVQVGDLLLFAYNVFIGLKKETKVEDVFSLFRLEKGDSGYNLEPVDLSTSFLSEPAFINDFEELYRYYKHTKLMQLCINNGKLLAGFQIGERLEDVRVFRWSISADGQTVKYIDNRGERDIELPPAFDFEWHKASREDIVHGRHAHVNVLDCVFIETLGGDLTIKIENNTEDGLGIYREPVEDKTQSLDDAQFSYAEVGELILLKVLPYKEEVWRYLVYNKLSSSVIRIDEIGHSCVQLPEDHGIIFPGGYYLQNGEHKTFDDEVAGLKYRRSIKSPSGEDVLYVFYEEEAGTIGLYAYNLIEKSLQNPIYSHGFALAEDGKLIVFNAETEATRIHPMQIWQTPYISDEFASHSPNSQTYLGKIGNAELVRGISDIYGICRMIAQQSVSLRLYEELNKQASKIFDAHYWLEDEQSHAIAQLLREVAETADLVIDEFEKVESIRHQSSKRMSEAESKQESILLSIRPENWQLAEEYVHALSRLRAQRGHLTTLREYRYIDIARIDELDKKLQNVAQSLSQRTVDFLSDEKALKPYHEEIAELDKSIEKVTTNSLLSPIVDDIESLASGLDLLSELMTSLKVDDATLRTRIIDDISEVYAKLNQSKAQAKSRQKNLGSGEAVAQFSAQFKLLAQSITNALGLSTTPEKCDEQLSRLLIQLEELESQFSDFDQFLADIMEKREDIYESFESHKQILLDERQRKAQNLNDAATRILSSIQKRSLKFTEEDALHTYFASDALVLKTKELAEQLRQLDDSIKADDIESQFKAIKEQSIRSLRDKTDIYEDGGNIIKLGPRHKFSVNTQELDLTIIPREGELNIHLTGTNYFEPIQHEALASLRDYWDMSLESESADVYRAEYLASLMMDAALGYIDVSIDVGEVFQTLTIKQLLQAAATDNQLITLVRDFAAPRYKEGYEKGVHDHDAAMILKSLLPVYESAGLLRFDPECRALAQVFWANYKNLSELESRSAPSYKTWCQRAKAAVLMRETLNSNGAVELLSEEIHAQIKDFIDAHPIPVTTLCIKRAADYLLEELALDNIEFIRSQYAEALVSEFKRYVDKDAWARFKASLHELQDWPKEQWMLASAWLSALIEERSLDHLAHYHAEAVALLNTQEQLSHRHSDVAIEVNIDGLLGDHSRLKEQKLQFSLDGFLARLQHHKNVVIPSYQQYLQLRSSIILEERDKLRLEEFKPRPLSSFVRNKLINESYLPLIGDNLAKQMGTVGDNKRTDLMGLLMMISPPGYGKTTLMEYVASRLGLIFMKINCPSLGHDVMSLDPQQAPNATAKQELVKLNLALEMGNNVMLYLDDIQHTHAEFLQKFISLCDGTRRIEGIWRGKSKTYDMRGRKFCVVMAGNPYTESGEAFKVPDMLANRADIYNLGDILGGTEEIFGLSYIENALTSNPVLAPMALRHMDDVYQLIAMAKGKEVASTDLKHQYSGAEINEITDVLQKLFMIQELVLTINQQYIASAGQDDRYRLEPPFKLQGSYRNMNKMTEKVSAVMNQQELMQMMDDHYLGESQLLTTGAESNLLKLGELRGVLSEEEQARWQQIKTDFLRNQSMGGSDDVGSKVVAQLADISTGISALESAAALLGKPGATQQLADSYLPQTLSLTNDTIEKIAAMLPSSNASVEIINEPMPGVDKLLGALADTIENTIYPVIKSMDKKIDIDLKTHDKMQEITEQLLVLQQSMPKTRSIRQAIKHAEQRPAAADEP